MRLVGKLGGEGKGRRVFSYKLHCMIAKSWPQVLSRKDELKSDSHSWCPEYEVKKSHPEQGRIAALTAGDSGEAQTSPLLKVPCTSYPTQPLQNTHTFCEE